MAGADLSCIDLSGMDLHGVVFSRWDDGSGSWRAASLGAAILARRDDEQRRWERADLRGAILCGVDLTCTLGLKHAILMEADLRCADLRRVDLRDAILWKAQLQGAELSGAKLQGARLQGACLSGDRTDLADASLQRAWLEGVRLDHAHMERARLRGASLVDADLQGADLWDADLRNTYLVGCNLRGADLRGANLARLDLRRVATNGLREVYLHNAVLDNTRVRRGQLEPGIGDETRDEGHWLHHQAREAYEALKRNFEAVGDHDGAVWSYLKARQAEKVCSTPWYARRFYGEQELGDTRENRLAAYHPRVWWFYIRHTWKWAKDWVVEALCDYGENAWRTLGWILAILAGSAVGYGLAGAVLRTDPVSGPTVISLIWPRDARQLRAVVADLGDLAIFALGAFTTANPQRLQPATPLVEFATGVQALVGIALTGLLGFVLGNRIRRS